MLHANEIKALARIVDELDYYQVLQVDPGAAGSELRRAYHSMARAYHPDANRSLSPELQEAVRRIAKRITEAYTVLRDPRRRRVYDERLRGAGGAVRIRIADADTAAGRQASEELHGRTPNGRRYSQLAQSDLARGDVLSAIRQLQTALAFEPDNPQFKTKLDELRRQRR